MGSDTGSRVSLGLKGPFLILDSTSPPGSGKYIVDAKIGMGYEVVMWRDWHNVNYRWY